MWEPQVLPAWLTLAPVRGKQPGSGDCTIGSGSGQLPGWLQGKTVGVGRAGWEPGGEEFMESFLKQLSPELGFVG